MTGKKLSAVSEEMALSRSAQRLLPLFVPLSDGASLLYRRREASGVSTSARSRLLKTSPTNISNPGLHVQSPTDVAIALAKRNLLKKKKSGKSRSVTNAHRAPHVTVTDALVDQCVSLGNLILNSKWSEAKAVLSRISKNLESR